MFQRIRPMDWGDLIADMAHMASQGYEAIEPLTDVWSAEQFQRVAAVSRQQGLLAAVLLNTINLCSTAVPYWIPLARTAITTYRPISLLCTSSEVEDQLLLLPNRQAVQDRLTSALHILTALMPKLTAKQLAERSSNRPGAARPDPLAGAAAASMADYGPTGEKSPLHCSQQC